MVRRYNFCGVLFHIYSMWLSGRGAIFSKMNIFKSLVKDKAEIELRQLFLPTALEILA